VSAATRRRPGALVGLLLGLCLVLASCGIPQDAEPREISRDDLPPELVDQDATQSTLDGDADSRTVTLYLVRDGERSDDHLVPVSLEIARTSNAEMPQAVVEQLLAASPAALGHPDLVNPFSSTTRGLRSATLTDSVVDLDLDGLSGSVSTRRLAVAQLVFTLTELMVPPIDGVRFSVDGTLVSVPVERGAVDAGTPVRPDDDPSLAPD
jgi:spore germination protein GerM